MTHIRRMVRTDPSDVSVDKAVLAKRVVQAATSRQPERHPLRDSGVTIRRNDS